METVEYKRTLERYCRYYEGYATKLIEDQKTLFKKHGITPTMLATKKFSSSIIYFTQPQQNHNQNLKSKHNLKALYS